MGGVIGTTRFDVVNAGEMRAAHESRLAVREDARVRALDAVVPARGDKQVAGGPVAHFLPRQYRLPSLG